MANSKQQAKRVRISERQRAQNLRYRSQIKTLFRRLDAAVEDGDAELVSDTHRRLTVLLDRASTRSAMHRNTAARKKSQAARIAAGTTAAV